MQVDRAVRLRGLEGSELGVDLGTFGLQACYAVADEVGVDASFDRSDLKSDLVVDLVELAAQALRPVASGGIDVAGELRVLGLEVSDALGAEDVVRGCCAQQAAECQPRSARRLSANMRR